MCSRLGGGAGVAPDLEPPRFRIAVCNHDGYFRNNGPRASLRREDSDVKIVLILLVLLGAAVVTVALIAGPELRDSLARFKPDPATTDVRIEPARLGSLIETVAAPGEIEPHTDVFISAVVSARIISLGVREGDEVRRGDVVCRLQSNSVSIR